MRCLLLLLALLPAGLRAQPLADTLLTWQGYGRTSQCRVRIYPTPPDAERTHTVVLQELAANHGASTLDEATYLAERVGRHFDLDPALVYWIFHWGAFSFEGAAPDRRKELFLRATFRWTKRQTLGTPQWRVVTREEVEDYTDRLFR